MRLGKLGADVARESAGRRARSGFGGEVAFAVIPPEVRSPPRSRGDGRQVVDLLHHVLTHVADEEITVQTIERETVWVAQADGPDLVPSRVTRAGVGVAGRDGVAPTGRRR